MQLGFSGAGRGEFGNWNIMEDSLRDTEGRTEVFQAESTVKTQRRASNLAHSLKGNPKRRNQGNTEGPQAVQAGLLNDRTPGKHLRQGSRSRLHFTFSLFQSK